MVAAPPALVAVLVTFSALKISRRRACEACGLAIVQRFVDSAHEVPEGQALEEEHSYSAIRTLPVLRTSGGMVTHVASSLSLPAHAAAANATQISHSRIGRRRRLAA